MIDCAEFYKLITNEGIKFYCGVPDSILKSFCAYLGDHVPSDNNFVTTSEGEAIALAAGIYLATNKPATVYMQNSGEGNAINPLVSLADSHVYGIPMLLIIGWRGEPGMIDEPQHLKQGEITLDLLHTLGIPHEVLSKKFSDAKISIKKAFEFMNNRKAPYAIIIRKDTFKPFESIDKNTLQPAYPLSREEAIQIIIQTTSLIKKPVFISTTGMASRELYENRLKMGQDGQSDFLTVGAMGYASSIALGIALSKPERLVFCIDGDGAMLMHMGALATIAQSGITNLKHILINNGAHDSVGGQPTCGFKVDFGKIALACGYKKAWIATSREELIKSLQELIVFKELGLLEIRVKKGARKDLVRPKSTPAENKIKLMKYLQ
jgi:phosphonopyruvate decarboxylase